ncbi:D site-binding protein-like [Anoplophora glabripennis]|uniref:D site-binding protein-like n=1 Tax=Anoplophora glabripennis TaxID=217634 RepID=UPI00087415C2|nr:D site-binding protein-like [Anoplophora glabripennis]
MHSIGPAAYNSLLVSNRPTPKSFNLDHDPPVLDLCVKKKGEPPCYTLNYPSPKHSPVYDKPLHHSRMPRNMSECSEDSETSKSPLVIDNNCPRNSPKVPRPFKAFPKNPLAFTLNVFAKIDPLRTESPGGTEPSYEEFRRKMLEKVEDNKGTNMNMRRYQNLDERHADPSYLERRKKNNEAAKKSREARKAREDEITIRCAFLEQENIRLKANLASVEMDVERLKSLIFRR